jgi:hypothetical protein
MASPPARSTTHDTLTLDAYFIQLYPVIQCWGCGGVWREVGSVGGASVVACSRREPGSVVPCSRCSYALYCDARCERTDRRRHAALCERIAASE